jgi:hypothetical protein
MKTLFQISLSVVRQSRGSMSLHTIPLGIHKLILSTDGKTWDCMVAYRLAEQGCTGALRNAREQGCPWDASVTYVAARNGHLNCLMYAHKNGCPWYTWYKYTTTAAAENGHLDCLQYAYEHGCPWDKSVTYKAAEGGHLQCLQYAHEHGCPWDITVIEIAVKRGHHNCARYALLHGCPNSQLTERYKNASSKLLKPPSLFDLSLAVSKRLRSRISKDMLPNVIYHVITDNACAQCLRTSS